MGIIWSLYSCFLVFEFWINNLGQECNHFTFFPTHFRPGSLNTILHFMEELSAIHSVSEAMSSSDRLMEVLVSMIKSPDKHEVSIVVWYQHIWSSAHPLTSKNSGLKYFGRNAWCCCLLGVELFQFGWLITFKKHAVPNFQLSVNHDFLILKIWRNTRYLFILYVWRT